MTLQDVGAEARTPSQLARRERIVAAATELLDEREYERIQIRDVADAASVARVEVIVPVSINKRQFVKT